MNKPISSIRGTAHAGGAFGGTSGLVLGTGIGAVGVRRSADIGWKCQNMKFSRNSWIRQKDAIATYLFPGSRWRHDRI